MSKARKVVRLEPNGPDGTGLSKMQLDPADFQSDLPEQYMHAYYMDESAGLTVGVWTTTSMQEALVPYPGDEFMYLVEGQVVLVDGEGKETLIKQGETFCTRNAIPVSWRQVGFLRKFYMTYADPKAPTPDIKSADGGVMVLDAASLEKEMTILDTTEPFQISADAPIQRDTNRFTNDTGNMFVGMWDSTPFESEMKPFPCHELVQMLEGEVTITEGDGTTNTFKSGDVFFVPMGTVCSWKVTGYIRKFYSILDPSAVKAGSS